MKRAFSSICAVLLITVLAVPVGAQNNGLEPREGPESAKGRSQQIVAIAPSLDERVKVFIQLSEPSVGQFIAEERDQGRNPNAAAKRNQANRVAAQQDQLRAELDQFDVTEEFELDYGANGLAVTVRVGDLLAIAELPNVTAVARVARHHLTNETSVPFIGAPALWGTSGDGGGISIAVIDTGIDYLHANFGGVSTIPDYENNDRTTLDDGGFTAKVVGGHDFAGDAYDASSDDPALNTPDPDPDPLDCNGHGSHVAGSAAGNGVAGRIGPGVAPGAVLFALKVFGCDGSTDVTAEAIEWAMNPDGDAGTDDAVDVINMSLGSDFGDPNDPSAIASQTAVDLGIVVVASAGNDGNGVSYVTGSPAVAPGVISVAALHDAGVATGAIDVESPVSVAGLKKAQEGDLGRPLAIHGPINGDLALPQAGNANGCAPIPAGSLSGKIALIQRGACTFAVKGINAQVAGAMAVLVYNNAGNALLTMAGTPENDIISMFIGQTDGTALAATVASETVNVTLDSFLEIPTPELEDQVVGFSSRGPGGGGTTFKPDVSAPGVNIRSTLVGSADRELVISGTSMSSPHVAGVAALLRQKYPNLEVDAIKALIMNSAEPTQGGEPITVQGTGSIRADAAAALGAYALPGGLTFGRINPVSEVEVTRSITVHDLNGGGGLYDITVEQVEEADGVSISAPASVNVPSGGSVSFDVTVTLDPAEMAADDGFQSQVDINGRFHLDGPGGSLVVGYVGAVDPAAAMTTIGTKPRGTQTDVLVSNPSDTDGIVDAFTNIGGGIGSIAAVGVRTANIGGFDVVEFGIASTASSGWEALSSYETDIFIDTNQDGSAEYALVAADLGYLIGAGANGQVVTALFDLVNGGGLLEYFVTGDFNDHAQVMTVDRFDDFGFLAANDATFDYVIAQFDLRTGLIGLAEGSVNLRTQADGQVNFSGTLPPGASATIKVAPSNRDALLALYSNNVVGDQFEVVTLK